VIDEPRSFDGGEKLLARLAGYSPRAYSLADRLGALRNRVTGRWPAVAEVQALFPHLTPHEAARTAVAVGALHERNRVLVRCLLHYGSGSVRPLLTLPEGFASLRGPRILATFHTGAVHAIGPALEQLGRPVLALRIGSLFEPSGAMKIVSTKGGGQARAAVLHRALEFLRGGGMVVLALDVAAGASIETHCLGRRFQLAPGAFALARWTGAPIVPIVARWSGTRIALQLDDPLGTPQDAAAWLERYLLERPSEITLGLLRNLLALS
jgi:hypothetical protein